MAGGGEITITQQQLAHDQPGLHGLCQAISRALRSGVS
jgi:hypothetical protein